jgi:hypothetical protein
MQAGYPMLSRRNQLREGAKQLAERCEGEMETVAANDLVNAPCALDDGVTADGLGGTGLL